MASEIGRAATPAIQHRRNNHQVSMQLHIFSTALKGNRLQALQRIHFCHSSQSLRVASTMTSEAWRTQFDFSSGRSRRIAGA
jgi:hypothetical protein